MSSLKNYLGGLDDTVWTDAKAGNIDADISSRAPASTALSTATWTSTKAGYLDAAISSISGGYRPVQAYAYYGLAQVSGLGTWTKNISISVSSYANCIVTGAGGDHSGEYSMATTYRLSSNTNCVFYFKGSSGNSNYASYAFTVHRFG